jgi:hypothetical protein
MEAKAVDSSNSTGATTATRQQPSERSQRRSFSKWEDVYSCVAAQSTMFTTAIGFGTCVGGTMYSYPGSTILFDH